MEQILVALDYPSLEMAKPIVESLKGRDGIGFKVGMQLTTAAGVPEVVRTVGTDVFLDLKFHDIPNTVAGAVEAASSHKVKMLNVHCLGGPDMLVAASNASRKVERLSRGKYRPLIIGVTILTSHDRRSLMEIGIDPMLSTEQIVLRLAEIAEECGLDGVVCSPKEVEGIRTRLGDDFIIVSPGIRDEDAPPDDQRRTMTIREAIDVGVTYPVIGRPITQAENPVVAAEKFLAEALS